MDRETNIYIHIGLYIYAYIQLESLTGGQMDIIRIVQFERLGILSMGNRNIKYISQIKSCYGRGNILFHKFVRDFTYL